MSTLVKDFNWFDKDKLIAIRSEIRLVLVQNTGLTEARIQRIIEALCWRSERIEILKHIAIEEESII